MCKHFWLIEEQNGHTCEGRCKLCGEVKVFSPFDDKMFGETKNFGKDVTLKGISSINNGYAVQGGITLKSYRVDY